MASHPKPSAKNETGEYSVFENALKKVLAVPHSAIQARLNPANKRRRSKGASASRASSSKG
jgi:hypothetical protein